MSDLKKYQVVATEIDDNWDKLVESSSTSTPFSLSSFIKPLNGNFKAFLCKKGNEIVAGCLVAVDLNGKKVIGHDLIVHDGIFFRDFKKLNRAQTCSEQFKALQAIAEFLVENFSHISITLPPMILDIRAFQWVHYHEDKPMYQESIQYTGVVDISLFLNQKILQENDLYLQASVSRRQEIRYGIEKGVAVSQSYNVETFLTLYQQTFDRQDIELSSDLIPQMRALILNLIKDDRVLLFEARTSAGELGSMAVFLIMGDTGYYLFGASDYEYRNTHTGTAVLWQAFSRLAERGINKVDLEGVNSPARGWFKLSFGAEIQPYYRLTYES
jgi:hypothetical protein